MSPACHPIELYIEGAAHLRPGFSTFFTELREACRQRRIKWNIILCGADSSTWKKFHDGLETQPGTHRLLLIDADEVVDSNRLPLQHIQKVKGWPRKQSSDDDQIHLMVVTMEAWFLADPDKVADYFGKGFDRTHLPKPEHLEQVPKKSNS